MVLRFATVFVFHGEQNGYSYKISIIRSIANDLMSMLEPSSKLFELATFSFLDDRWIT